ncbi:class I SAM-dependent methyltransferase [Pseudodesulfovibrio sp.]|uniref:class I SAM-dependent methyltransferase n=1 Tax=unclassified Pseudodesulfovibrio TaxID=2661612 RepID=UPI003AFF7A4B
MTQTQVEFFDAQTNAPWASTPYGADESRKIGRFFELAGQLTGKTVLEPGCGTGRMTEVLANAVGIEGSVYACDISPRMVEAAQKRLNGMAQAKIRNLPMEKLKLDEGVVDAVLCHQVFPHYENKPAAMRYIARVLKPGGDLFIMHFKERAVINDVHRKAGTVVEQHKLPELDEMDTMLDAVSLTRVFFSDTPEMGYLLHARKQEMR